GKSFATGHYDRTARLWNAETGKEVTVFKGHRGSQGVKMVAFSPDGTALATAGTGDRTAKTWDIATGKQLKSFKHPYDVYTVAFTPDGKALMAAGRVSNEKTLRDTSGHCKLWELATGKEQLSLQDK